MAELLNIIGILSLLAAVLLFFFGFSQNAAILQSIYLYASGSALISGLLLLSFGRIISLLEQIASNASNKVATLDERDREELSTTPDAQSGIYEGYSWSRDELGNLQLWTEGSWRVFHSSADLENFIKENGRGCN